MLMMKEPVERFSVWALELKAEKQKKAINKILISLIAKGSKLGFIE
jgi:hypothetical protein